MKDTPIAVIELHRLQKRIIYKRNELYKTIHITRIPVYEEHIRNFVQKSINQWNALDKLTDNSIEITDMVRRALTSFLLNNDLHNTYVSIEEEMTNYCNSHNKNDVYALIKAYNSITWSITHQLSYIAALIVAEKCKNDADFHQKCFNIAKKRYNKKDPKCKSRIYENCVPQLYDTTNLITYNQRIQQFNESTITSSSSHYDIIWRDKKAYDKSANIYLKDFENETGIFTRAVYSGLDTLNDFKQIKRNLGPILIFDIANELASCNSLDDCKTDIKPMSEFDVGLTKELTLYFKFILIDIIHGRDNTMSIIETLEDFNAVNAQARLKMRYYTDIALANFIFHTDFNTLMQREAEPENGRCPSKEEVAKMRKNLMKQITANKYGISFRSRTEMRNIKRYKAYFYPNL